MKTKNRLVNRLKQSAQCIDIEFKKDNADAKVISQSLHAVNSLVQKLDPLLGTSTIKKIVGATVFSLLIRSNTALAQKFEGPKNAFNLPKGYYYSLIEIADLDDDGDYDVLVGEYYGGLKFYKNKGTPEKPKFLVPEVNPFGFTSDSDIIFPRVTDIDGDGDLDLVTIEDEGYFFLHENSGTKKSPKFSLPKRILSHISVEENMAFHSFKDLDGDGREDFILKNKKQELGFYSNNKNQTKNYFDTTNFTIIGKLDSINICFQLVDIDEDGDLDVTTTDGYDFYFLGNSGDHKNFDLGIPVNASQNGISGAEYVTNFQFIDIDNDGDLDLFYSQYYYGEIKFFENISK